MYLLHADKVRPIPGKDGIKYEGYSYGADSGEALSLFRNRNDKENVIPTSRVIHVKNTSLTSIHEGKSEITRCISLINLYARMLQFQHFFFMNNATPTLALETEAPLGEATKKQILSQFQAYLDSNANNNRRPIILDDGMKITPTNNFFFPTTRF